MSTPARRQSRLPDISDWFESFGPFGGWRSMPGMAGIRVEDYIEGEHYVLRAELPGIDPDEDLELNVARGVLTLHAERSEDRTEKNHSEFRYGSFSRSVRLPEGADEDSVAASYRDGILTVRVGLARPSAQTKKVPISRED